MNRTEQPGIRKARSPAYVRRHHSRRPRLLCSSSPRTQFMISGEESIVVSSRNRTGRKQERWYAHTMCGIIAGAFVSFLLPTGTGPVRSVSGSNLPNRCGIKKNEFELKNEKFQKKIPKIFQVTTSLTVSKKIQISVRLV